MTRGFRRRGSGRRARTPGIRPSSDPEAPHLHSRWRHPTGGIVLSQLPVARVLPSGENTSEEIQKLWPLRTARRSPVSVSKQAQPQSGPPRAPRRSRRECDGGSRRPGSGGSRSRGCRQGNDRTGGVHVPEPEVPRPPARREGLSIRGKPKARDPLFGAFEPIEQSTRGKIPKGDVTGCARGCQHSPLRGKGDRLNAACVRVKRSPLGAASCVPERQRSVLFEGGQRRSVGGKCHPVDPGLVTGEAVFSSAGCRIPETSAPRSPKGTRRGQNRSIRRVGHRADPSLSARRLRTVVGRRWSRSPGVAPCEIRTDLGGTGDDRQARAVGEERKLPGRTRAFQDRRVPLA